MISESKKHEVLERRVEFMAEFILAMRDNDVPEQLLNLFKVQDREFLCGFCYKLNVEPEKYMRMYNAKINRGYE